MTSWIVLTVILFGILAVYADNLGELILNLDADLRVQVNINTPVKLLIIISVFIASEFIQCLPNVL
jgi:hypothetical protein